MNLSQLEELAVNSPLVAAHLDMYRFNRMTWDEMKNSLIFSLFEENKELSEIALKLLQTDTEICTREVDGVVWHNETARQLLLEQRRRAFDKWQKG